MKMRLVPKGWQVPARIIFHPDPVEGGWQAVIDGVAGKISLDPVEAGVDRVWHSGTMISESEYLYLNALRDAAKRSQPDHPCLSPDKPINPALLRPIEP